MSSCFSLDSLRQAWCGVLANDMDDGTLSPGVTRFATDVEQHLSELADALDDGSYTPAVLTEVELITPVKVRTLHIPPVADRVVARSILTATAPAIDPALGAASYAYRPGLGVADAVQRVVQWRTEGYLYVVRTDVHDCFLKVPKELAFRRFASLLDDQAAVAVVRQLLDRPYRTLRGRVQSLDGLPQGCPLSPILANLVLVLVDDALMSEGFPMVRYGDDICIAVQDPADGQEALRVATQAVEELGMTLGADKTDTMSFSEGFAFLGEEFGPRYPPELQDRRTAEPDEKVLYVGLQGSRIRMAQGRIIVESKDDQELLTVPSSLVCRIVCFGSVGLSAGARTWALTNDIDVVFASRSGSYAGSMVSDSNASRPVRIRAQLDIAQQPRGIDLARAIVEAKVTKQRTILMRFTRRASRDEVSDAVGQLEQIRRMLPDAHTTMELMGLEGAAARFYFPCLGALFPAELAFTERSRRPPVNVANAALSYLYTILLGESVTALHGAGLDPSFGILHSDQVDRPSLALDLMEEWRPMVVDQVVLTLARAGELTPASGYREPERGMLLTKAAKTTLVDAYERRMLQRTSALPDFAGTLRRHLYRQAHRLRASIMSSDIDFTGLSWR